jgi:transposase
MEGFRLTYWQERRLEDQLKQTTDAQLYRRTLAVLEVGRGTATAVVAATLGVSRQSIYRWVEAYCRGYDARALQGGHHPGRPRRWTDTCQSALQFLLQHRPDDLGYFAVSWTVPLLQEELAHIVGQQLSDDTIRRALQRLGYVWKRGRYVLDPDPEREKKTPDSTPDRPFAAPQRAVG